MGSAEDLVRVWRNRADALDDCAAELERRPSAGEATRSRIRAATLRECANAAEPLLARIRELESALEFHVADKPGSDGDRILSRGGIT